MHSSHVSWETTKNFPAGDSSTYLRGKYSDHSLLTRALAKVNEKLLLWKEMII